MSAPGSDRELLIGVMAVQLGFASAQQVMTAAAEWATDRKTGVAERLTQKNVLSGTQREMLEALVSQAIQVNHGDVRETIQSLGGDKLILQSLGGSLLVPRPPVSANDDEEDKTDPHSASEEDLIAVSVEDIGRYTDTGGGDDEPTEIGRGGIGRVLVAFDQFLQREIAIKELLPDHNSSGDKRRSSGSGRSAPVVQRFLREARVTGRLEHPNIVPVYELGRRKDGTLYYTMKLVRGRTLAAVLQAARSLDERLALLPHFLGICNALAYAHSRGVIHRDVKPQNVMVGEFGETVVLDWGLAKVRGKKDFGRGELKKEWVELSGAHSIEGSAIGTPAYMSPEQAEGKVDEIDERSDVWSLGAMLYEVLTGKPPYEGVNPFDVIGKLLQNPITPVREVTAEAPQELAAIAEKALQRSKGNRYQSAKQFAEDVQAWLSGKRVRAHEYSSWELVRRFGRKNRVALSVLGIAAAVLLVFGVVAYKRVEQERDVAREFAGLLISDVAERLEPLPGSTPLLEKLTTSALQFYRRSVDPATATAKERADLAKAYERIGQTALEVGKYEEARNAFGFARELYERLHGEAPQDLDLYTRMVGVKLSIGDTWFRSDTALEAENAFLSVLDEARALVALEPNRLDSLDVLSRAYSRVGQVRQTLGDLDSARDYFKRALENDSKLAQLKPDDWDLKRALVVDQLTLAEIAIDLGELSSAESLLQQSSAASLKLIEHDPNNRDYAVVATYTLSAMGIVADYQGDPATRQYALQTLEQLITPFANEDKDSVSTQAAYETYLAVTGDFAKAGELARWLADNGNAVDMGLEEMYCAVVLGDVQRVLDRAAKLDAALAVGPQRTGYLTMKAAALALSGDKNAPAVARDAARMAKAYGGQGRFSNPGWVLPQSKQPNVDAVRALFTDLYALKGSRDKAGWTHALDAFARRLEQTP